MAVLDPDSGAFTVRAEFNLVEPVAKALAVPGGWVNAGGPRAGHYVKLVHGRKPPPMSPHPPTVVPARSLAATAVRGRQAKVEGVSTGAVLRSDPCVYS